MTTGFQVPNELVSEILEGRCVAFVGAGFSSNMPTWGKLLEQLAEPLPIATQVSELLANKPGAFEYEAAGQLIRNAYGAADFETRIREVLESSLRASQYQMQGRLKHLREIPFATILTTNYDPNFEGLSPEQEYPAVLRGSSGWWSSADELSASAARKPQALKLHGDANGDPHRDQVVLAKEDYRRLLYRNGQYANFLKAIFATKTILFLGVSFSDAYLNELRSEVLALLRPAGSRLAPLLGYATKADASPAVQAYFLEHEGIRLLPYDSQDGTNHDGFDHWLAEIHRRTAATARLRKLLEGKQILWVDGKPENNLLGEEWLTSNEVGAKVTSLRSYRELNQREHQHAKLIISSYGYRGPDNAAALDLLNHLRHWEQRPPVIVFSDPDPRYVAENRERVLRRGAYELATRWGELFELIERLFGRRTSYDPD